MRYFFSKYSEHVHGRFIENTEYCLQQKAVQGLFVSPGKPVTITDEEVGQCDNKF